MEIRTLFRASLRVFTVLLIGPLCLSTTNAKQPELTPIAQGLVAPINILTLPDQTGRQLILDQSGIIWLLNADKTLAKDPYADIRARLLPLEEGFEERGLLGLAVHPEYGTNGRIFVTYSAPLASDAPANWNYTRIVSEYTVDPGNPSRINPNSERVLIRQHWPSRKHNGGALAFGPNGYLHIGFGDAGGIHGVGPKVLNDAFNVPPTALHWDSFAQDTHTLYGKMLRIDVDRGYPGYAVPDDNPFVGKPGRDEIYAWGFRNPYRISFDPDAGGSYYLTAVAETFWEAVYHVNAPGNYGWPLREGTHCFDRTKPLNPPEKCARDWPGRPAYPAIDPVVEYPNMSVHRPGSAVKGPGVGTAVVGAIMLREKKPRLLFADWSLDFKKPSGQLFEATPSGGNQQWPFKRIAELPTRIVSMTADPDGNIYVLTNENFGPYGKTGKVFQLTLPQ
jgi:glucose/arabinose dehydrogenase